MLRSSDLATTKVFCTIASSGMTISANSRINVNMTITLKGLPTKFRN